ncbi:diguanylate cyclase [Aliikangiella marina]|uniref:diguanylate cyclase n=1 Tax=Aliikangiella marina TaxID=1712262 RepID=A0A545T552_9GAMM|nr:ligand-binding sensor domain-containing diguanylate cyclase [Aliikangiella marina]TQV72354.1 diguanylate cyclase [Aliikangiella marina]
MRNKLRKYALDNYLSMLMALAFSVYSIGLQAATNLQLKPNIPTYFRHVSVQQGLSQVTVADILQDKSGFMWFATQNGINRFDGYEFIQYKRDKLFEGVGPIGDYAYKLALDDETSDIWVATSGGLSRYLYQQDRFKHYDLIGADGERRYIVTTVVFDRSGQMWVGTRHGLFRYQKSSDSFSPIKLDISASAWVLDIALDKSGELLVATTEGLFGIDISDPTRVNYALIGEQVNDIELLDSGDFWFATTGKGVYRKKDGDTLNASLFPIKSLSEALIKSGVNSIKQIKNQDIWISANAGLTIVHSDQNGRVTGIDLTNKSNEGSLLSAAHMTRTYESQAGLIWQGTWTSGFSVYDPESQQIGSYAAVPGGWIRGLARDNQDNVWFGAPNGIWKRHKDGTRVGPWLFPFQTRKNQAAKQRYIRTLAFDNNKKQLWAGTTSGLYRLIPSSSVLEKTNVLVDTNIFVLDLDHQGDLWIGTFNQGLYWLDGDSLEVKGHWAVATVTHIFMSEDTVYAGTIEGLILIDKRSRALVNLNDENRPIEQRSPRVVTWISKANNGDFLLGTQGSGIYRMRVDMTALTFEALYPNSHLATLSIGGIQEDESGNLWASTTEGLAKIETSQQTISYYNKRNGAFSEGYYINHSLQLSDGEIIFAGPKGMSSLFPDHINLSSFRPVVAATKLLVLNKPISVSSQNKRGMPLTKPIHISDTITLGPKDNVFSIEFSALDYSAPENNLYQFKLEGFDGDWIDSDANHRVATYTNLDPGNYQLNIKGSNKDGIWSDKVKTLEIIVLPPWYWNTWTKILWALLTIGLFSAFYRWRIWSLKAHSQELSMLVKQRTLELEAINAKLMELSTRDELSQLKNRRGFSLLAESELQKFKRTEKPFSILMVDIDHFKDVNDEYGHAAGDKVLVGTAEKMKGLIRKQDHIARWGGEEFIILAVETPLDAAVILAQKIRKNIKDNVIAIKSGQIKVTVTIGVSEIQPHQSLEQCINRADKHLYRGKESGRNRVCY